MDADHRARRAPRRAGDHDLQGQGPDPRRPPAGRRRPRALRHAGRVVADERGRPADRARRVVRQPHRHLPGPPDDPGRPRPLQLGSSTPSTCRCGATSASTVRRAGRRLDAGAGDRPARRRRDPPGAVARPRRPAARATTTAAASTAPRSSPRSRATRRTTPSSPSTSATTPTRSAATSSARGPGRPDVGLPRLDRLRLPGGDGRVGGDARTPHDRDHRRRRLRAVHGRAARPPSSTA